LWFGVFTNSGGNLFGHARAGNVKWSYAIVFAAFGTIEQAARSQGQILDCR
jgi:uncharacterized membrane protein YfcA